MRALLFALSGAAGVAMATIPATASAAELIDNGSFEAPLITGPCCNTVPSGSLPGWTITSGNVNVVNGTFGSSGPNLAGAGSQYLDLIGEGSPGTISQTFSTVAGWTYTLSFLYSHNLFGGLQSASGSFSVGNLSDSVTHSTGSASNLAWQSFTGTFTGTGSDTLTFTNTAPTGGNAGLFLDAVSVQAAVPEPGTWLMMILGFLGVGFALRRRRPEVAARMRFA